MVFPVNSVEYTTVLQMVAVQAALVARHAISHFLQSDASFESWLAGWLASTENTVNVGELNPTRLHDFARLPVVLEENFGGCTGSLFS